MFNFFNFKKSSLILGALFLCLTSCQLARPTRITESHISDYAKIAAKSGYPIVIADTTLIIDARSAFDYQVSNVSGSINISPRDFNDADKPSKIKLDQTDMLRRLASYGLDIATPVVVLDKGRKGKGEAGRVALMLFYLGVSDVRISDINPIRKQNNLIYRKRLPSTASFKAIYKKELFVGDLKTFQQRKNVKQIYVGKKSLLKSSDAIEIPFSKFLNKKGRPNFSLQDWLIKKGVGLNQTILVSGPNINEAGAAAFVLLSLGYSKTRVYDDSVNK